MNDPPCGHHPQNQWLQPYPARGGDSRHPLECLGHWSSTFRSTLGLSGSTSAKGHGTISETILRTTTHLNHFLSTTIICCASGTTVNTYLYSHPPNSQATSLLRTAASYHHA